MSDEQLFLSINDDLPILDFDAGREDENVTEQQELLTISLFKQAIYEAEGNQGDRLLADLAKYSLPKIMSQLAGSTAKGGQFFERLDARGRIARRDNAGDQSNVAHLLNGLLPTYRIARRLQQPDVGKNQVKSYCEDLQFRVGFASYLLHDREKFPDYKDWLIEQDIEEKWIDRDWVAQSPKKEDAPNLGRDYVAKKSLILG